MRIDSPIMTNAQITGSFTGSFSGEITSNVVADSVEYANVLNKPTLVSGSDQIDITQTSGYTTFSSSIAADIAGLDGEYATDAELNASSSTLQSNIDTVSSNLSTASSSLAGRVTTNEGDISTLSSTKASITQLNTSSSALQSNIDGVASDLDTASGSLAGRVTTNEGAISTLSSNKASIVQLNASSSALQSNIDGVQTNLDTASGSLAGRLATIEGDNATQTELDAASASLAANIASNASSISSLTSTKASITQLNASSSTLQSNLDSVSASLAASITGNDSDLTSVSSSLAARITSNDTDIASNASAITTLQGTDISITLTGDVTGTGTITNLGNVSFATTVADDSHAHIISNVDGLQDALNLKAPLASPALTGTPTAPTATGTDSSTKIATTAFVQGRIDAIIGTAGSTLDTLGELSASLSQDSSSLASLVTTVGGKLQKDQNLSDLTSVSTARTNLGLGGLATLSSVNAATITDNSVGAAELNVSGNGTTSQFLRSDGDGTFSWAVPTDTNTTYSAGSGLDLSGTTFSHSDTSTQTSISNTGRTYIQSLTLDGFGHVTGASSATETVTDTNTTYSAGSGLGLSGTTFSHADTSTQTSVNNTGRTYIQDITLDGFGHVTGIASATETVTDTNTTYSAGSGISLSGTTFSVAAGGGLTQEASGLAHADTSTQASVNNSGRTYIQDITLDGYGHVTGISSATETVVDTNTTYSAGTGMSLSGTTFNCTITNNSQLTNGAGYITSAGSISGNAATATKTIATVTGTNAADLVYGNMADNDQFRIRVAGTASNAGYVEIATADDGSEPIYVRQYSGVFTTLTRTATLLDGSGNTSFPGSITAGSNITAYSDERLKKDVSTIENALDKTKQLRGVEFTRIADDSRSIGVIAQELEKILPELVATDDEGMKSVNYGQITGLLIEAVKELSAKVEALENK